MYKFNIDNIISKNFLKFAWFLTKQDIGINESSKDNFSVNRFSVGS